MSQTVTHTANKINEIMKKHIDWVVDIDTPPLTHSRVLEEMYLNIYQCTNLSYLSNHLNATTNVIHIVLEDNRVILKCT